MSIYSFVVDDKQKDLQRKESLETVYSSNSRLNLLQRRKKLNSTNGSMSNHSMRGGDRIAQRVLSAKTHRVKQLQNQLADAHYHLQELSNENRILRALQKKQEVALQRYENSSADLPTVLNSHTEEMRIQQAKFKQLKQQYKEMTMKIKEKDLQLQQLRDEHQHLLELSRDKNLMEREKLQNQVAELTAKVEQQNATISTLQRRLALEAKNFQHRLQAEINRHKDTRHHLDQAINNADKLSLLIEMKQKMAGVPSKYKSLSNKASNIISLSRPTSKTEPSEQSSQDVSALEPNENAESQEIAKLCENSRSISSALSREEDEAYEARSRHYTRNRSSYTRKSTPNRIVSKETDTDVLDLTKTVQNGMNNLSLFDDEIDFTDYSSDVAQKKIEAMKAEMIKKIKSKEDAPTRKSSGVRKCSTEESIEEQIEEEVVENENSYTKFTNVRRNSAIGFNNKSSLEESADDTKESVSADEERDETVENKNSKAPINKYCKDIIAGIEKSSKIIDKHIDEFKSSKFEQDRIVEQLHAVDKMNELVTSRKEIPEEALVELNNNFKTLTDQVYNDIQPTKKRLSSGKLGASRSNSRVNLFGDANLSNKDLLNDLLGKK